MNNDEINKAGKSQLREYARTHLVTNLSHAEVQAVHAFISQIKISECKQDQTATGLYKILIAAGKAIAEEQGI